MKKDILVLARPDHSYSIYKALLKSDLNFLYCSFKLFPEWSRRLIKNPRVRYYGKNYSNCLLLSILHIYRTTFNKRYLERYEKPLFQLHLSFLLPRCSAKLIHYWPNFCLDSVRKYKEKHSEVKTFAEVYFPCEHWVQDYIRPVLEEKGLDSRMPNVDLAESHLREVMKFEKNFLVPSKFVADTYKKYYPDKNYIIIPYGIPKWESYRKKSRRNSISEISSFVYAGAITIQKGCDLLLDFFVNHSNLSLHLYGNVPPNQKSIFSKYHNKSNIFFHGIVPKAMLQQEVNKYDVGIHMSRYDAYSLSVGEILGAGLPMVVSQNTGNAFQIEEIGAGLVANLNIEDLAAKIDEICQPNRYNTLVDCLDKYLTSNHKTYEEEILDFYKKEIL